MNISLANGEYSLNGSAFTKVNGSAVSGDTIELKAISSSTAGEARNTWLMAGTLSVCWTIKNGNAPWAINSSRELIDSFSSLNGWNPASGSAAGTQTILTKQGPDGQDVLRITVNPANAYRMISKDIIATDFSKGWFGQWVRFPNLALAKQLGHLFYREPMTNNGYYQRFWLANKQANEQQLGDGDWHFIMWRGNEMPSAGKQSDGLATPGFDENTIWFNKIFVASNSIAENGSVDYGPMYANIRQDKPRLLITFDDSNESDYSFAYPYLKQKGIKATTYTITTQIGQRSGLNLTQLHELQNAGWSIAAHGETDFTLLTHEQLIADLNRTKNWLINNGFTAWQHMAYPLGGFNPTIISTLKDLGFKSGRSVVARNYPLIPERGLFYLGGAGTSGWTSAAAGIEQIDSTIAGGGTMIMFSHRVDDSIGSRTHTNKEIWQQVIDYAAQKRDAGELDIVTIEELQALIEQ